MKKTIATFAIIALLAFTGCKNEEKTPNGQTTETEVTDTIPTQDMPVGDTSQTSLDWAGVYSGTLPCGDCPGIETEIQLNDNNTYALSLQYLEKEETARKYTGTFTWDDTGSIITLDANGDHKKYKIQEGSIKMLDKFGDPKQGDGPEKFILKRID